jgi:hypothetical protein
MREEARPPDPAGADLRRVVGDIGKAFGVDDQRKIPQHPQSFCFAICAS